VFLTHLHADHTGDLAGMLLYPWGGRTGPNGPLAPVRVYGPSRPETVPDGDAAFHRETTIHPERPAPGSADLVESNAKLQGSAEVALVCGRGTAGLAAQAVQLGESEVVVAGGMESMSNCPYLLKGARTGFRLGNQEMIDSMINDGLWDVYENYHMGVTGENVAEKYKISREKQDRFAFESHQKAIRAIKSCFFGEQIVPVAIPQKKGDPVIIKTDESPREDTSMEALGKLKPAFKKDGTVTAGNAPGTNDGAAAVIVTSEANAAKLGKKPMARIVAQAVSGVEPKWVMMAPVEAVEKLLAKTGWDRDKDVDLIELNEAFAVAAIAVTRELRLNPEKVNVNGGAVALGHPIGASGARVLVTLLYELQRRNLKRGIAALCLGGGNAVALAVERY